MVLVMLIDRNPSSVLHSLHPIVLLLLLGQQSKRHKRTTTNNKQQTNNNKQTNNISLHEITHASAIKQRRPTS
jgi:hypothetical protein